MSEEHRGPTIMAAAIKLDGTVHSLPPPARHHTIIGHLVEQGHKPPIGGEQGFITSDGEFVNRFRAGQYARRSGQIEKLKWPPDLYSEDLW